MSTRGGIVSLCLVMFAEQCYGAIAMLGFLTDSVKNFISDTKELVGLLTAIVILLVYIRKLRSKKEEKEENG